MSNKLTQLELTALEGIAQMHQLDDGTSIEYNEIYFYNDNAKDETIQDLKKDLDVYICEWDEEDEDQYLNLERIITKIKEFYKNK